MEDLLTPEALEAHLTHLRDTGGTLGVITPTGMELEGLLLGLDASRRRLEVEIPRLPPQALGDSGRVTLALAIQHQRWEGLSSIQLRLDRTRFALAWPQEVTLRNRRSAPRVVPHPPGQVKATLKVGREGPLLTGPLLDLSTGGFCMHLERAMSLESRSRLDPAGLGLSRGQELDSVEITGLREDPLEASGILRDLDHGARGYQLHVQFRALLRADRAFLDVWIAARQQHELVPLPPPVKGPDRHQERQTALLRLKKRLRSVAILMEEGPERTDVATRLANDGYGRILEVDSLPPLESTPPHAVVVASAPLAEALVATSPPWVVVEANEGLLEALERSLGLTEESASPGPAPLLGAFKRLGLAMPEAAQQRWQPLLSSGGFHHLVPMGTLTELASALADQSVDAVIVDVGDERLTLATLELLGQARPEHPWPMAVVAAPSPELAACIARLGGIRRVEASVTVIPVLQDLLSDG